MTDHRINLTLYKLDRMIEGEGLDELIDALMADYQASLLGADGRELTTVADLLAKGEAVLAQAGIAQPRLDARLLLQHALGADHAGLIARLDDAADGTGCGQYSRRRLRGVQAANRFREYAANASSTDCRSRSVRPCLIRDRRPKLLVDRVLADHGDRKAPWRFADIGTGSGAIALALLANLPAATCVALDISAQALEVAAENAANLGLAARFSPLPSDYLSNASGEFHFIVSNPPYIPANEIGGLSREVREHDPLAALSGGGDGLDAYRAILTQAAGHLLPGGRLYL